MHTTTSSESHELLTRSDSGDAGAPDDHERVFGQQTAVPMPTTTGAPTDLQPGELLFDSEDKEGGYADPFDDAANTTLLGHEVPATGKKLMLRKRSLMSKRIHKESVALPWLSHPPRNPSLPWVPEDRRPNEWLKLFYDLAVAAVLAVFAATHSLNTPADIPDFLAYFVIIQWMWSSQLHYDGRYEADDRVHRILKGIHVLLFVYIGAASGKWKLDSIVRPNYIPGGLRDDAAKRVLHVQAHDSFLTVALAILGHRVILACQYILAGVLGHRAGRPTYGIRWQVGSQLINAAMVVVSIAVPANSNAMAWMKVGVIFGSILFNIVAGLMVIVFGWIEEASGQIIADRYSTLSLMVTGEGVNRLALFFQKALNAWGQANSTLYAQILVAIGILYCLWGFMFSYFRLIDDVDPARTWLWEMIHYPLHFGIFMLYAGICNMSAISVWNKGVERVLELMDEWHVATMPFMSGGTFNVDEVLDLDVTQKMSTLLSRLDLDPDWRTLTSSVTQHMSGNMSHNTGTEMYQYMGQMYQKSALAASMVIPDVAKLSYRNLTSLPLSDMSPNVTQTAYFYMEKYHYQILTDTYKGSLWLFPVAGVTLILCAVRSMIRYHFNGRAHWIIHGISLGMGMALALLGLLDIGPSGMPTDDQIWHAIMLGAHMDMGVGREHLESGQRKPIYTLVKANWAVSLVFLAYLLTTLLTSIALTWADWLKGRKRERLRMRSNA